MTRVAEPQPSALEVWEPRVVDMLPAGLDPSKVNLLVPTVQIRQVNPYLVPDLEMVKLDPAEGGGDVYRSNDMKAGHWAPTARALGKIANVAGIDVLDSRRIDDGRDPDAVEWRVVIEMALPSGQRVRRSGTKRIDLHQLGERQSPQWLAKAREHLIANAETKAFNRAVRAVLSLHGAMPLAAYSKPFAILRWVPNMNDPDVRRRMLDNLLPATVAAYGPHSSSLQLGAGAPVEALDIGTEEAPEEDEAVEGEVREIETGGRSASVDRGTGEIVAESREADPWEAGAAPAGLEQPLRKALGTRGPSTALTVERRDQLRELFAGVDTGLIIAGLRAAFGLELARPADLTDGQAAAILEVAASLGRDPFLEQWEAMAK